MPVQPDIVLQDLKAKKYAPIYFLQGDESFYIDVITEYIEKNILSDADKAFNQVVAYGQDIDITTILNHARAYSMFSDRKVVIIKEAQEIKGFDKKENQTMLEAYIKNPLPSTILVFSYKNKTLDARKTLAKIVDKHAILVTTKKMYDNEVPSWSLNYVRSKGFNISVGGNALLCESVGNNLSRIANEVDKLVINIDSKVEITEALVQKYVGESKEYSVFELQKALAQKNVLKANKIIDNFASNPKNNPLVVVVGSLASYFLKVLMIHHAANKDEKILASVLKVNPFFVKDYIAASRLYSPQKTLSIIHYLKETDLQSKGVTASGMKESDMLKELIFKILH